MRRWLAEALALATVGCAFEDGRPWGQAALSLTAAFDPPAARLDADGALKTSGSFAVRLDEVALTFDAVALRLAGDAPSDFDPADPPPGYSLCHNGHCHAADGRLVPYEEIEAGAGDAARRVARAVTSGPVALGRQAVGVALGPCADGCHLPRGTVSAVEVTVHAIRVAGRVYDRRPEPALDPGGVPFTALVPLEVALSHPLDEPVDDGEPVGLAVAAAFELPPALFDGLDFAALLPPAADAPVVLDDAVELREALVANLVRAADLGARATRFDP